MGSFIAVWRLVLQRAAANWKMLGVLALGMLVAATLLASAPIYSRTMNDLGLTYTIRERLPSGPGSQVLVRDVPVDDGGTPLRDAVDRRIDERLGWFTESTALIQQTMFIRVDSPGETTLAQGASALFQSMERYDEHVMVVDGRLPAMPGADGAIEVAMSQEAAANAGVALGDQFLLTEMVNDCEQFVVDGDMPSLSLCPEGTPSYEARYDISVVLVGVIEPADIEDQFWISGAGNYFYIRRDVPGAGSIVPLWVPHGAIGGPISERLPGYTADTRWNIYADPEVLNRANFNRAREDLVDFRVDMEDVGGITASPLSNVLALFDRDQGYQQTPLTVLLLQVAGIALFYVALVSGIILERQSAEISLLRSRGATLRQVLTLTTLEGLLVGVPILLIAPLLAAAATAATGLLPVFEPVSGGDLLPVTLVPLAFGMAAIGVVLSLAALLIPAAIVGRRTSVSQKRAEARPQRSIIQRYYLDLVFVAFAALLLWELDERGSAFQPSPTGGVTSDPVLLASPALIIAAAAALVLRFYPPVLAFLGRIIVPAAGASLATATWQVVRSPGQYTRLALLLMMAIAVGTFAASYSSTAQRSYRDRADFESGVDLRGLNARAFAGVREPAEAEQDFQGLPGSPGASLIVRDDLSLPSAGPTGRPVQTLAVDPVAVAPMLYARDDFADESIESLLFRIQTAPVYRGLEIPPETEELSVWVSTEEPREDITLWARVRDERGRQALLDFGKLDQTGWHEKRLELFSSTGATLTEPVYFLGFVMTEPPNRFNSLRLPLYIDDLVAHTQAGEEVVLEDFEIGRTWQTLPESGEQQDRVTIESEEVNSGEFAAKFEFRLGVQDGRRAIFPADPSIPLVALASRGLLDSIGRSVGDEILLNAGEVFVRIRVVGEYRLFPTLSAQSGPSIIFNRDQLLSWVNAFTLSQGTQLRPNEAWFDVAEGASTQELVDALEQPPFGIRLFSNRARELERIDTNPLIAAGGSGILQLSFVAVIALVGAALLLSLWTTVQRRRTEFAVLRAMGLSRRQILAQLSMEYTVVAVLGIAVGVYLGVLVGRRMLSFLDVTATGEQVEPGFILQTDWTFVALGAVAVIVTFALSLLLAVRALGRTSDAQALRTE